MNYIEPFMGTLAVLLARPHAPHIETGNDKDAFLCVGPETRILMSNLTWKRAGEIIEGESILAFDENNVGANGEFQAPYKYRHWRYGTVLHAERLIRPSYRLTFEDGTTVVASEEHMWLAGSHTEKRRGGAGWRWVKTGNMICNRQTQRTWVLKLLSVTEQEQTRDAGWLAGFFDGEGYITARPSGFRIGVAQNPGPELDRAERLLQERGFSTFRQCMRKCIYLAVNGGMREALRFLMAIRPQRLIRNLAEGLEHKSIYARDRQAIGLVAKEYLGEHEVISLTTTTRTFVAEGLASHNCNVFRAIREAPDEVVYWCDRPVCEADQHAIHSWLVNHREEFTARLMGDPDYYDAKVAGRWLYGINTWIGAGWCSGNGAWQSIDGKLVRVGNDDLHGVRRKLVHLGDAGRGIHRQLVHLGNAGRGIHGLTSRNDGLRAWMDALAARLRSVRICCGDWTRVLGPSVTYKHGMTAVLLDPPYSHEESRQEGLYRCDDLQVAHAVRAWCKANGQHPLLRIALCGYGAIHDDLLALGWHKAHWTANGGFSNQKKDRDNPNKYRETIWFSPACVDVEHQLTLFGEGDALCK